MKFNYNNANKEQLEAITSTEGPLLIIAGPGTGKTFTLIERTLYLIIKKGVDPKSIMLVTFTDKAAQELLNRISKEISINNLKLNVNDLYVGTFHSLCLRLLKEYSKYTNVDETTIILDEDGQKAFFNKYRDDIIPSDFSREEFYAGFTSPEIQKAYAYQNSFPIDDSVDSFLLEIINECEENLFDVEELKKSSNKSFVTVGKLIQNYVNAINKVNALDFTSIQVKFLRLITENKEILEELSKRFEYIMVDEYQDTSFIEETIVSKLCEEKQNLCVVGDDDQALYRFRGATVDNILTFKSKFKDCKQVILCKNYRSEPGIINYYNKFMLNPFDQGSALWHEQDKDKNLVSNGKEYRINKKIIPAKENQVTNTNTVIFLLDEKRFQEQPEKLPLMITQYPDISYLILEKNRTYVLKKFEGVGMQQYRPNNTLNNFILALMHAKKVDDLSEIAFLTNSTKNAHGMSVANMFEKDHIPAYVPRSSQFYYSSGVQYLLYTLHQILINDLDEYNKLSYVNKLLTSKRENKDLKNLAYPAISFWNVSKIEKKKSRPSKDDYMQYDEPFAYIDANDSESKALFNYVFDKKVYIQNLAPIDIVDFSILDIAYELLQFQPFHSYVGSYETSDGFVNIDRKYFSIFFKIISDFDERMHIKGSTKSFAVLKFTQFFEYMINFRSGLYNYEDKVDYTIPNCISVMTVHQAKGLEFPIVISTCGDFVFPNNTHLLFNILKHDVLHRDGYEYGANTAAFDAARRRYVALSRAKNLLIVTNETSNIRPEKIRNIYLDLPDSTDISKLYIEPARKNHQIESISFTTDILPFEICPFSYGLFSYFKYPTITTSSMIFGKYVHKLLSLVNEELIKEVDNINLIANEILKDFIKTNKLSNQERFAKILSNYLNYLNKNEYRVLKSELKISTYIDDFILVGVLDVLVMDKDEKIHIIDLKTDSEVDAIYSKYYKEQLFTYSLLLDNNYSYDTKSLINYYCDKDQEYVYPYNKEENNKYLLHIKNIISKIKNKDFIYQVHNPNICAACPFNSYCNKAIKIKCIEEKTALGIK